MQYTDKCTCLSPNHFVLSVPDHRFLFYVSGLEGQLIRIDVTSPALSEERDSHTNPFFSYAQNVNTVEAVRSSPMDKIGQSLISWNGNSLPATEKQSWHFIPDVWEPELGTISFVYRFEQAHAYIGMRVPRTPSYNEKYFSALAGNSNLKIVEVGQSAEGRSLLVAETQSVDDTGRVLPTVLMYAGEHADEPDAMWVVDGAIRFLGGDSAQARLLRQNFNFIMVPLLDPDASASGMHEHILGKFSDSTKVQENIAYANWFEERIAHGGRIDIALDLHSAFMPANQVACALLEGEGSRGKISMSLHKSLVEAMRLAGFRVDGRPWQRGWSPERLGGWLSHRFGTVTLAYEFNSQATGFHMNLEDLKLLGSTGCVTAGKFLGSKDGEVLLSLVDDVRRARLEIQTKSQQRSPTEDAISYEARLFRTSDQTISSMPADTQIP